MNLQPFQKVFVYFYLRLYSFHTFRPRQFTSSYVFRFVLLSIASIFTYRSFLCPFSHLCNVITICYETYSHSYAPATFFDFLFHCLCVYFIRFSHAALTKNGQKLVTCIKINQPIFCPTNYFHHILISFCSVPCRPQHMKAFRFIHLVSISPLQSLCRRFLLQPKWIQAFLFETRNEANSAKLLK